MGIYARLSKEDGDNEQSESIDNQIELIKAYLQHKKEFTLIDTYIDDGYSGLRYDNRPEFQRMLLDVKDKRIDTIITKDISRFGRESIETSLFLEKVFPQTGIRYISILDCYDSLTGQNTDIAPFKILFNDMYSKDISKKVRGSFEAKRKNGLFIGSTTPYGYKKNVINHNKLIIDEVAASTVRRIYALYMKGHGQGTIATMLEKEGILAPTIYKKEVLKENYCNPNVLHQKVAWSYQTIHQILTNQVYIGNMVQKKQETISYKIKKKRKVPKEEQIVVAGTHEAIIDQEMFERVQEKMKNKVRSLSKHDVGVNLFEGKLICAECRHMFAKTYDSRKQEFVGYVCSQYKRYGNMYCSSHRITRETLEYQILNLLKQEAKNILKKSDIEELSKELYKYKGQQNKGILEQLKGLHRKEEEIKKYKKEVLEAYFDGMLTKEEYLDYKCIYDEKLRVNSKKRQELEERMVDKKEQEEKDFVWFNQFVDFMQVDKLTREMVIELIDNIVIDEQNNIYINLRFQNE